MEGKWTAGSFLWLIEHWPNHSKPVCYYMSISLSQGTKFIYFSFYNTGLHNKVQVVVAIVRVGLFVRLPLSQESVTWGCVAHIDCVMLWWECVEFPVLFLSCFARSDASVPTPDALLILEVRVILTWSSFNWQIEWISLTTSLSSHSALLHLTQWVELTCHLGWQLANPRLSVSFFFSHSQIQIFLIFLPLSVFLLLLCLSDYVSSYSRPVNTNLVIKSGYDHCRLADRHDY